MSYRGGMDTRLAGLPSRFWSHVDRTGECWLWTGAQDQKGYGSCSHLYGSSRAHRAVWISLHGPVARGLMVDHLCHVRRCVNPAHLRVATAKQNAENRKGPRKGSRSGIRGVCWYPRYGKWVARVGHDGRVITVGYFDTVEEAGEAAALKRSELHSPIPTRP